MLHFGTCLPGPKLSDFLITLRVEHNFLNVVSGGQKLQLTDFMTTSIEKHFTHNEKRNITVIDRYDLIRLTKTHKPKLIYIYT